MRNLRSGVIRTLVPGLVLILASSLPVNAIIYGEDDRTDLYDATPTQQVAANAVFMVISSEALDTSDPTDIVLFGPTLSDYQNLCPTERFGDQTTAGWCSGTLIDDDLMMTAGHCIESSADCPDTLFVFNYTMVAQGVLNTITADDVYNCEQIVAREYAGTDDFVIVKLDRPVTVATPAPVRRRGLFEYDPATGPLFAIGHPYGIPVKIAGNASPQDSTLEYFASNSDTFGGNSGSGVYDEISMELVGILVRGNDDWVDNGTCNESVWCPESGCVPPTGEGFEEAVRSNFLAPWVPPRCGDGLCDPGEDEASCSDDCPQDSDYDLQPDQVDNCPFVPNPVQENSDGDPLGDACDCDFTNGDVWNTPGEVLDLAVFYDQITGWTQLTWNPPGEQGATSVVYDTLRSDVPFDFDSAALCLESDDGVDLSSEDWVGNPVEGAVIYYVVRAENACPLDGTGPIGWDSRHRPRPARACP